MMLPYVLNLTGNEKMGLTSILFTMIEKLTPYFFQNDVALCFEPYWKRENGTDINFWC